MMLRKGIFVFYLSAMYGTLCLPMQQLIPLVGSFLNLNPERVVQPVNNQQLLPPATVHEVLLAHPKPVRVENEAIRGKKLPVVGVYSIIAVRDGGLVIRRDDVPRIERTASDKACDEFILISSNNPSVVDDKTLARFVQVSAEPSIILVKLFGVFIPSVRCNDGIVQELARLINSYIAQLIENSQEVVIEKVVTSPIESWHARVLVNGMSIGKTLLEDGLADSLFDEEKCLIVLTKDRTWRESRLSLCFKLLAEKKLYSRQYPKERVDTTF